MKGDEKISISINDIRIDGLKNDYVMHNGEESLMCKLAEIVTKNGGDILEIGFGMHLSADAVQSNLNVTSHTIIEIHPVKIILGDWVDVLPTLQSKFDGILHDTHLDSNISKFLDYVKPNCKEGTIVGFFQTPVEDYIFNAVRHKLTSDEVESLPYSNNRAFRHGYELKYTTFDGKSFVKHSDIKTLI